MGFANGRKAPSLPLLTRWQLPAVQVSPVAQVSPHAPQFARSLSRLASHPSAAAPLQLPKPLAHAPIAHAPAVQVLAALANRHARAQLPQLAASLARSTQAAPQQVRPAAQVGPPLQPPVTQMPLVQVVYLLCMCAQMVMDLKALTHYRRT